MTKLEKLTQDEYGKLSRADGTPISSFIPIDTLKTIVVVNSKGLETHINTLCIRNSVLIPKFVNAYYASDFNEATGHSRYDPETKEDARSSVYAVQFVHSWEIAAEQSELQASHGPKALIRDRSKAYDNTRADAMKKE